MLRVSRLFIAFLLSIVLVGQHLQAPAASAVSCAARVAVLGADMSPGGRFEVQRALAVGPHTWQLDQTIASERSMAHGLVPPDLLGSFAISSALLHPLPAGSGLTVTVSPGIRLETAQAYANALLTAGITDADVSAAAPTSQQTRGATALLGLLRAAPAACLTISPARQDLAIREIVLSSELALWIGRQQASALLYRLKNDAASRALTTPDALAALVAHDAAAQGVTMPAALRPALASFLHDLVASGAYKAVAAAHPNVASAGLQRVTVRLGSSPPRTQPASNGARIPAVAGAWHGKVAAANGHSIAVQLPNGIRHFTLAAPRVLLNGRVSSTGALRSGETVTITTDAAGNAVRIDAAAPIALPRPTPAAASGSLNAPAIAVLALLLLLALALLPLLVGYARSRRPVMVGMAVRARSSLFARGARPPAFTPKGRGRAPLRHSPTPRPVPEPDDNEYVAEDDTAI